MPRLRHCRPQAACLALALAALAIVSLSAGAAAARCTVTGCAVCMRGRVDVCAQCYDGAYVRNLDGSCDCAPGYGSTTDYTVWVYPGAEAEDSAGTGGVGTTQDGAPPVACQPPDSPYIKRITPQLLPPCVCIRCPDGMVSTGGALGAPEAACRFPPPVLNIEDGPGANSTTDTNATDPSGA